jgi:hypothetical protein
MVVASLTSVKAVHDKIFTDPPALFVIITRFHAAYIQHVGNRQNKKMAVWGLCQNFVRVFSVYFQSSLAV